MKRKLQNAQHTILNPEFELLGAKCANLGFSPTDILKVLDISFTKIRNEVYQSAFVKLVVLDGKEWYTICSATDPERLIISKQEKIASKTCAFRPLTVMDLITTMVDYKADTDVSVTVQLEAFEKRRGKQ